MDRTCTRCKKTYYGQFGKKNRCVYDGYPTRKEFGFSGPPQVSKHTRANQDNRTAFPSNTLNACATHGWSCVVFGDHATRHY